MSTPFGYVPPGSASAGQIPPGQASAPPPQPWGGYSAPPPGGYSSQGGYSAPVFGAGPHKNSNRTLIIVLSIIGALVLLFVGACTFAVIRGVNTATQEINKQEEGAKVAEETNTISLDNHYAPSNARLVLPLNKDWTEDKEDPIPEVKYYDSARGEGIALLNQHDITPFFSPRTKSTELIDDMQNQFNKNAKKVRDDVVWVKTSKDLSGQQGKGIEFIFREVTFSDEEGTARAYLLYRAIGKHAIGFAFIDESSAFTPKTWEDLVANARVDLN